MSIESVRELANSLGHHVAKMVVQNQVVYPKTTNINLEKALYSGSFESSLLLVVQELQNSIELQAIDAIADCMEVLKMMDEFQDSILLRQADYVIISKGGFEVVMLKNNLNPQSGRSIFIELNSCRRELFNYIETTRRKRLPWFEVSVAGSVVAMAVLFLFHELRYK